MMSSRSTAFFSSRTLPRQGCRPRASIAAGVKPRGRTLFSAQNCRAKCSTRGGRSSGRSRRGGTRTGTTESRKKRSSRKRLCAISSSRSLLVAAMTRTSTWIVFCEPMRSTSPSCSTRSTLAWVRRLMSPTSSRKIVPLWASSNLPICFSVAPVNEPLLVAEQLALDQLLGDRGAVHLDERLVPPVRVAVDGPGHQLLAHPALAGDEHGRVRGRGAAHRVPDLLEGGAAAHHPVAVVEDELQAAVLLDEPLLPERVAGGDQDALALRGLLDEVPGPELHRLDRGLDRPVAGQDHHRGRGVPLLEPLQDLEPVHLRHLDVEEDEVRRLLLGDLQPHRAARGEEHLVPLVLEDHLEGGADRVVVVDDEHPGLHGRFSTSTRVRNDVRWLGRYTVSQAGSPAASAPTTRR